MLALSLGGTGARAAGDPLTLTEPNVVTGTLTMRFGAAATTQPASAAVCTFDLTVAKTTEFTGTISREANQFVYALDIAVLNPKNLLQKKVVGRWVGDVPYGAGGYALAGGKAAHKPLRIVIDPIGKALASADPFGGKLRLWDMDGETSGPRHYERATPAGRVTLDAAHVQTLGFQGVELAQGPAAIYPHTSVTGRIDYDAGTTALIVDGMTMTTRIEKQRLIERVNGTIRWLPDATYAQTGRGEFAVNLGVTPAPIARPASAPVSAPGTSKPSGDPATTQAARVATTQRDFFSIDPDQPALVGTVSVQDTFLPGSGRLMGRRMIFQLHANQLGKPQILAIFKTLLLGVMPAMDCEAGPGAAPVGNAGP